MPVVDSLSRHFHQGTSGSWMTYFSKFASDLVLLLEGRAQSELIRGTLCTPWPCVLLCTDPPSPPSAASQSLEQVEMKDWWPSLYLHHGQDRYGSQIFSICLYSRFFAFIQQWTFWPRNLAPWPTPASGCSILRLGSSVALWHRTGFLSGGSGSTAE